MDRDLHFDFQSKGDTILKVVEKWLSVNMMSSIAYHFQGDASLINYYNSYQHPKIMLFKQRHA